MTAPDHFLQGEQYRTDAASQKNAPAKPKGWEPNRPMLARAMEQYRLAIKKDPEHYWAHYQLGRMFYAMLQYAESAQALTVCIALRPHSPWGYFSRAQALEELKRHAEAQSALYNV